MLTTIIDRQYNFTFLIKTVLLILILLSLKLYLVYSWSYLNYYVLFFSIPNIAVFLNIEKKRLHNFLIAFTSTLLVCVSLVLLDYISKRYITHLILLSTTTFFILNYKYVYKNHLLEQNTSITNYLNLVFTLFIIVPLLDIFYFIRLIPLLEIKKVFLFCATLLFCFFFLFTFITIYFNLKPFYHDPKEAHPDYFIQEITTEETEEVIITEQNTPKNNSIQKEKLSKEALYILDFLDNTNLYLDPDFTIDELAKEIAIQKHILSRIINHDLKLNFYSLLAKYRIDYAKELILKERNLLLDGIMAEAGFNSRITFNKYFKEFTGLTPSEYRNLIH